MFANASSHKTSTIFRFFNLLIFTLLYVALGYVVIENKELAEILPRTNARSAVLLISYVAMLSILNYGLANKANNWTDWKTEIGVVSFFMVIIIAWLGSQMYKLKVAEKKKWLVFKEDVYGTNYWWLLLLIINIPLGYYLFKRLSEKFK